MSSRAIVALALAIAGASAGTAMAAPETVPSITHRDGRASFDGAPDNFTGHVHVDMLMTPHESAQVSGGAVSFAPGARTAWHAHPLGQTLIVTAGLGRIEFWGGPVREMHAGDVVWIPPGVKHWHGAAPGSSMTHIAIAGEVDGKSVTWLEKVSDAQYGIQATAPQVAATPSAAQKLFGDVAPGLAQLTDDILFGDVWNRPGLSKRDRSLVTVSALVAMNRPDQLRAHLALARQNGLSQEELTEAITHLAFYAGWPSAVTAAGVAKDVFAAP